MLKDSIHINFRKKGQGEAKTIYGALIQVSGYLWEESGMSMKGDSQVLVMVYDLILGWLHRFVNSMKVHLAQYF